ncbi:MAG: efflux RND transporter periplasmic adaptor subunit [Planctomycetota bacterium]|nr:MAG: efflux RND transporter periplasmic adaptor subunit [Planctomycetota bacterium]
MASNAAASLADATTPNLTWWHRSARRVWLVARIGGVLAVTALAIWWFALAPVAVSSHTIARGDVTAEVLGTGTLEARVSAVVGPKISGLITEITADQGDTVTAGSTLIYLEGTDLEHQVAVSEADVAAAKAGLDRLRADQARAAAVQAQARLTHERLLGALASSASSRQEVDRAAEALAVAEAEIARAAAGFVEGQKRLAAAERSLDFHRARLHDTTVEAPFDGLVVRRDRDAGDVVTAGSSVLHVVSLEEMWITAWVDETELSRLAEGQTARVIFRSEPETEYPGVVARLGRETDRETREILVDVRVDRLPATWAIGQRAEVYIRVDHREDTVVLPASLLLRRDGGTGVMVDEGGRARWHDVVVGLSGREVVEVASGLVAGDVVVAPGTPSGGALRDGRRIRRE